MFAPEWVCPLIRFEGTNTAPTTFYCGRIITHGTAMPRRRGEQPSCTEGIGRTDRTDFRMIKHAILQSDPEVDIILETPTKGLSKHVPAGVKGVQEVVFKYYITSALVRYTNLPGSSESELPVARLAGSRKPELPDVALYGVGGGSIMPGLGMSGSAGLNSVESSLLPL